VSHDSPFKIVFWVLVILMTSAGGGASWLAAYGLLGIDVHAAALAPLIAIVLLYICIVASVVYRDASRRDLDPWLWTSVATFLPYLLGVILYLVRRADVGRPCPGCGKRAAPDWQVCPACRHELPPLPTQRTSS
jgi:hypothetical protein